MPKNALFLLKNRKNSRGLGAPPDPLASGGWGFCPKPLASDGWGLRPQTPIGFRRLEAPPPDPRNSAPPHDEFLATHLALIMFKNLFS